MDQADTSGDVTDIIRGARRKEARKTSGEKETPAAIFARLKKTAGIISGAEKTPPKGSADVREADVRISGLAKLIRSPPKSLMESGNIQDLRREQAELKSKIGELSSKIIEVQGQIRRIDQGKAVVQADLDEQTKEEAKLQESIAQEWQTQAGLREQIDTLERQKAEEDINRQESEKTLQELALDERRGRKTIRELNAKLEDLKAASSRAPAKIASCDEAVEENLRRISEYQRRLISLDMELAEAKTNLETSIQEQRAVAEAYDVIVGEKAAIESAYSVYEGYDRILVEKERLAKDLECLKEELAKREEAIDKGEEEKRQLKTKLGSEEENEKRIQNDLDATLSKQRSLESNFGVYAELDDAARQLNAATEKVAQDVKAAEDNAKRQKETAEAIEAAKNEIRLLNAKEEQLKKKLDDVLNEKQRLEDDLQAMSDDAFPHEKLIIELPEVLREAIKKETDKLTAAQEKIKTLEKDAQNLTLEAAKIKEQEEKDAKAAKTLEKQLLFVKGKLGSSGYGEPERLLIKRQIDSAALERKDIENQLKASEAERKEIKSKIVKTERQTQKIIEEIEEYKACMEAKRRKDAQLTEELKANRERKVKAWAGNVSFLRILYPLKSGMDQLLNEKSKIKAELEEAERLQKEAELDFPAAEKYVIKCRAALSKLEEEYVNAQSQLHVLEKSNIQLKADKEATIVQGKEAQEHIPLTEAELSAMAAKMAEVKSRMQERTSAKRQYERNVRMLEASIRKLQRKIDAQAHEKDRMEEKLKTVRQKIQAHSATIADENTKLIKALDERQTMESQLAEYKNQKTIVDSEIDAVAGVYAEKP